MDDHIRVCVNGTDDQIRACVNGTDDQIRACVLIMDETRNLPNIVVTCAIPAASISFTEASFASR